MYEIFKELLEKKGVRPADVAKATGIAPQTFSAWKAGYSTPKQDKLKLIADFFGVTLDYLMGLDDSHLEKEFRDMYIRDLLDDPKIQQLVIFAGGIVPQESREKFIDAFINTYNAAYNAHKKQEITKALHHDETGKK